MRLTEWLEGITPGNGYQHDLSTVGGVHRVFRGRDKFGESDPLPCIAILEPLNPDRDLNAAGDGRVVEEDMILLIQGWADADETSAHPTDTADRLLADMKKRTAELIGNDLPPHLAQNQHNLFGLLASVAIEPGTVRQPDQFSASAYCYFRVQFTYVESMDDPYSVV
jgi:hypothetical protein